MFKCILSTNKAGSSHKDSSLSIDNDKFQKIVGLTILYLYLYFFKRLETRALRRAHGKRTSVGLKMDRWNLYLDSGIL